MTKRTGAQEGENEMQIGLTVIESVTRARAVYKINRKSLEYWKWDWKNRKNKKYNVEIHSGIIPLECFRSAFGFS